MPYRIAGVKSFQGSANSAKEIPRDAAMRVTYHPDFPNDIRKFEADYKTISDGLAARFHNELEDALGASKAFTPIRAAARLPA
jgi:hypothetical protein